MTQLTSLFMTGEPKLQEYDLDFFEGQDPVKWALGICRQNARAGLSVEAQRSLFAGAEPGDDSVVYVGPNQPRVLAAVLNHIAMGKGGHASLQMFTFDDERKMCRFEPGKRLYDSVFKPGLDETCPLGHYAKLTLWFSASAHVYEAHSDLGDGFLFQVTGTKHVKVWPLPEEHTSRVLFNHTDRGELQSRGAEQFTLTPGHVLFIPQGAMHEVTVESGESSVSFSCHLGGPYPVLSLTRDLQEAHGGEFSLPEEYAGTTKADITHFQPGRYDEASPDAMPAPLREELCRVIDAGDRSDEELSGFLDEWWASKRAQSTYGGPYPRHLTA
jgi:hypothetical protein